MAPYNPYIHHRRSIRLKGYDYAKEGLYFITINCQNKWPLFGKINDEQMHLNTYGLIAHNEWLNTENIRNNCILHEFIIMPDHMHCIIEILFNNQEEGKSSVGKFQSPSQTIGSIVRGYKIATIKKIKSEILHASSGKGERANCNSPQLPHPAVPAAPTSEAIASENLYAQKKIIGNGYKIWQRNYHDQIIKDEQAYTNISNYIRNNPKNWNKKKRAT
jgi:REP element-mobilizing transposase RayT